MQIREEKEYQSKALEQKKSELSFKNSKIQEMEDDLEQRGEQVNLFYERFGDLKIEQEELQDQLE